MDVQEKCDFKQGTNRNLNSKMGTKKEQNGNFRTGKYNNKMKNWLNEIIRIDATKENIREFEDNTMKTR